MARATKSPAGVPVIRAATTITSRAAADAYAAGRADVEARLAVRAAPAARLYRRRRRATAAAILALAAVFLVVGQLIRDQDGGEAAAPGVAPVGSPMRVARPVPGKPVEQTVTTDGFLIVAGRGPVLGDAGTLRRFRVAVEESFGAARGDDFAAEVERILGDRRSWVGGRQFRLQRVPASEDAEFTIFLASAERSEKMCAKGGLDTEGYTSCRLPGRVVMNLDRWRDAVPGYGAPVEVYRAYAINHEVGHQLGHGHETCTGKGRPAPVMMQQTYGLQGCVANPWPYLDGRRYAGNPVP
ncbi:DUF3152 domain-containing protein [Couchioplanes caeruleus]|uniref:Uncharacterized protein DUF3152 n=2 Tax=Couchioplanes caeruleus TaxID=56438 RepID=A0A3N1GJ96_9ACTN|nr:DUF3152 domain-containing protein [Couchioplanes caeruleus]ROP30350.1 uncharacterized protein DUF3152 [Couchioplanes caeruleus]